MPDQAFRVRVSLCAILSAVLAFVDIGGAQSPTRRRRVVTARDSVLERAQALAEAPR